MTISQLRRLTPASGDRSHIPANAQSIFEILNADMQRVKSRAPANFKSHVIDAEKRLNILFDHLNNEDLLKPDTVDSMSELARALQSRNYDEAHAIHVDIMTNKTDECGNWMVSARALTKFKRPCLKYVDTDNMVQVGVKRLITMSRATP